MTEETNNMLNYSNIFLTIFFIYFVQKLFKLSVYREIK